MIDSPTLILLAQENVEEAVQIIEKTRTSPFLHGSKLSEQKGAVEVLKARYQNNENWVREI